MNQDNLSRPSARLGNIKERIIVNRMLQTSVIGLAVFLLAFTLIPNLIAEASAKSAQVQEKNIQPEKKQEADKR